ncbi:hypothetical protein HF576_11000 [Microbacterium sp. CFH 90308]|uniref:SpaA-like prealbumin fold domain-containing protein n=1 Tax=Microbacterium salsuginis TaxID=2722803 RepID=A0ABX1KG73_9MICO|nr:SpaA isopeptide-forming pilin-related protein [Microbacterium sp. CFH 90308]NLP84381.1 hypothetical protein [Microbacterium sp. CFH 90308]
MRRSLRGSRATERGIALRNRWGVGGFAALLAGALVFSGVAPASADEGTPPDTPGTEQAQIAQQEPAPDAAAEAPAPPPAEAPAVEEPVEAPAEAPIEPAVEEQPVTEGPVETEPAVEEPVTSDPAATTEDAVPVADAPVEPEAAPAVQALEVQAEAPAPLVGVVGVLEPATNEANNETYWEDRYAEFDAVCFKFGNEDSIYGSVTDDGLTVTLNPFDEMWDGEGFVALIIKGGNLNNVVVNPESGVAYASPPNPSGNQATVSHWIVCIGEIPDKPGSLTIVKRSAAGAPLAGATFTISPNPLTGEGSLEVTTGDDGTFSFDGTVLHGVYTVTETDAPSGYLLPASASQQVAVGSEQDVTVTFVDPLGSVTWLKHDGEGALLGGATFQIAATGGDAAGAPWELDAGPITVLDNTGQPGYTGRDTDADAGEFLVTDLPTGTYSVVETVAPAGYDLAAGAQMFTISDATPNPALGMPFVNVKKSPPPPPPAPPVPPAPPAPPAPDGPPALAVTGGGESAPLLLGLGFLAMLTGALTLLVTQRRRGEEAPTE